MKISITIGFLLFITLPFFAQSTKKQVEVVSKNKKYSISGVEVKTEDGEKAQYKTLLIRFARFDDPNQKEVTIDGKTYKAFQNKNSAVSYYYVVRDNSPDKVIYYVYSLDPNRSEEVYTFKKNK